jgi:putative ABC transport system permease protein
MIKNYLKIAFRNFRNYKGSSAINLFGLTIGITSCLLIGLYIHNEINYDHFQSKADRIARVIMEYKFDGGTESIKGNFTSIRVAAVFPRTFPEIEAAIRMVNYERVVEYKDRLFSEKRILFADSNFFDFFSFNLLAGDPHLALAGPYKLILTESSAKKYFGNENPIGKTLRMGNDSSLYQVTGVIQDCPANSQIKFDLLASFSSLGIEAEYEKSYWDANYTTFLLLKNKESITVLQRKIPAFMKKEMEGQGAAIKFFLEPFLRIHLYSPYGGFEPNNNIAYIYILGAVALLILIIVCSTYINLSTARSIERAKEVGVRKVIGASRKQLFLQFIGESVLLSMMALLLSIITTLLVLPFFNQLTERQLDKSALFSLPFILFAFFVLFSVSLVAGTYPALILTGFQPVKTLKGSFSKTGSGQQLRKLLIIFQFTVSVFLIVSTLNMQKQLYYIQHKKLGYDREHVLILPMDSKMLPQLSFVKQEFTSNPDILSVSRCVRSPIEGGGGYNMRSAIMPDNQQVAVSANPVDEDYLKTVGLQIIAGSDFTVQDIKDVSGEGPDKKLYHFILNEAAAKQLGWTPEKAVGQRMFLDNSRPGFVKGVVKDFHFESLHNSIKPFVLFPEIRSRELLVKLSGHHLNETISFLEKKWKSIFPDRPFEYHFMDNDYNKLYNAEIRLGTVMGIFSGIAIVLACLGLFGLSSYATQIRFKEIGIRKILGASVFSIVLALSRDFVKLATIAILIAFPISWWAIKDWLDDFAYRIDIAWEIFIIAGISVVLLALMTVSIHALKAAMANPVKSLRTE